MKAVVVSVLVLATIAYAKNILPLDGNTAYNYLEKYGIPEAERIRKAEESLTSSRIVGGVPAGLGQYVYQAGLLSDIIGFTGVGVCGASLVTANRLVTAAHCWFDGVHQAWRVTVVLGSVTLFSGGTRLATSVVVMHPNWSTALVRNDIAMIYLPSSVTFSNTIGPIALPSGAEIDEDFAGATAIASGFGATSDDSNITSNQFLSHVSLNVISNSICSIAFPFVIQPTNICTSGIGGIGTCGGDSGGPLALTRGDRTILIGVTAFGSVFGCQANLPSAFARVTSFLSFIEQHLN